MVVNNMKRSKLVKGMFFSATNAPVLGSIYKGAYSRQIRKKIASEKYPPTMSIEPYNVCNLKCIMCPYKSMTRKKQLMPMALFKKIIDNATDLGIRSVNLSFYNEPLIDPHIFERVAYAKSKGLVVTFYSNGNAMNSEKIKKLLDNPPDVIYFSFDGASKEVYEKIRVGGHFEIAKNSIKELILERNKRGQKKPFVSINFTIQKDNAKEAKEFENFWKGLSDKVDFGIVDNRSTDSLIGDLEVKKPKTLYPCRRIWSELTVMSSGEVALCCVDYDGKVIVGNLKKQTIQEIWNSERFKQIRKLHLDGKGNKIPICQNCSHIYRHSTFSWWI
jgi:radical SAM protein with 4Fe4S-binding SPASM domain